MLKAKKKRGSYRVSCKYLKLLEKEKRNVSLKINLSMEKKIQDKNSTAGKHHNRIGTTSQTHLRWNDVSDRHLTRKCPA